MSRVVLVVEDDTSLRASIAQWIELNGFVASLAGDAEEALVLLSRETPDVVLSDVRMPGAGGIALLEMIRQNRPDLPVVLLSGHGDVPMAVKAIQAGAFNFLTKPYVPEQLISILSNAIEQAALRRRLQAMEMDAGTMSSLETRLIGDDPGIIALRKMIVELADLFLDVLIIGETGSGKEVVARALHDLSPRRSGPFVAINCAAIPSDIFENELFGHEAGAFTGASSKRIGKFEFANKGTIFFDEIESMPLVAQAKLLRVLQERRVVRLGSNKELAFDVRVVSATKVDLREKVHEGSFREDLWYRLIGAEIIIPPLRARGGDLLLLFEHFVAAMVHQACRPVVALSPADTAFIQNHPWPGNVREMKLLAERFALGLPWMPDISGALVGTTPSVSALNIPLAQSVESFERSIIEKMLARLGGSVAAAARALQISRRTLQDKIVRYGIDRDRFRF